MIPGETVRTGNVPSSHLSILLGNPFWLVDQAVISVLAFLHILSAIGWLGAAIFFLSVLGPTMRTLTPGSSLEFFVKVGSRQIRFFAGAATLTIVFGVSLLFAYFGTNYALWPTALDVGFTLGLIAYVETMVFTLPHFRKAHRMAQQMASNPQPGPPPAEFLNSMRKGQIGATFSTLVILVAAGLMVVTAFPV